MTPQCQVSLSFRSSYPLQTHTLSPVHTDGNLPAPGQGIYENQEQEPAKEQKQEPQKEYGEEEEEGSGTYSTVSSLPRVCPCTPSPYPSHPGDQLYVTRQPTLSSLGTDSTEFSSSACSPTCPLPPWDAALEVSIHHH